MNRRLVLALCVMVGAAASACTIPATPSPWRQALVDRGVQKRVGELVVLDEGSGPAVVMLHGLGGSAFDFRHQREPLLKAGFRVIVPDFLGAGYSGLPKGADYGIPAQAERVLKMLDELGVSKAHFVGNSYGGGAALFIAIMHPERVDRLVLIDAAAIPQEFPWYVSLARSEPLGDIVFAITPKRMLVGMLIGFLAARTEAFSEDELAEYAHEHRFDIAGSIELSRALRVEDAKRLEPKLADIKAPTLVFWGALDRVIPLENGRMLASRIPGASLEVLDDCGHVPHMERPAEVTRRLLEFLEGPPAPANGHRR